VPARLSRCGLHNVPDLVLGLDTNPRDRANESIPLVSPANATVITVDTNIEVSNGGLGNFVALEISMNDIPQDIKNRLQNNNQPPFPDTTFGSIVGSGYIYIGYGHLQSVEPGIVLDQVISQNTIIGYSGATGNAFGKHLHVTAFYSPRIIEWDLYSWGPNAVFTDNYNWYFTAYDAGQRHPITYGDSVVINPLVLWPSLQQGTGCPFWSIIIPENGG
jgi:murein DD-endopeptidase MepM/ murein hydrolase activator NlpD